MSSNNYYNNGGDSGNMNSLSNNLSRMSMSDQQGRPSGGNGNNDSYVPPHLREGSNTVAPVALGTYSRSGGRGGRPNSDRGRNNFDGGNHGPPHSLSSNNGGRFSMPNRPPGQGHAFSNNYNNSGSSNNNYNSNWAGNQNGNYAGNDGYYNKGRPNMGYNNNTGHYDRNDMNNTSGGPCNHMGFNRGPLRGYGTWDPKEGHMPAPRDPEIEKHLFSTDHVATGINFDRYDDIPVDATGNDVPQLITDFKQANLHELLMSNVELAKYSVPTPVQKFSIPIVAKSRDLMACAQTGSGKTAGFLFPILDDLFKKGPMYSKTPCPPTAGLPYSRRPCAFPCAIILSPTRELCQQIYDEAKRFSYRSWVRPIAVYGGTSLQGQQSQLREGCTVLVATPGRLIDFISRNAIALNHVRYLVLDEADRMLDMGFEPQIREIVGHPNMPDRSNRTTLMFSATFPREIQYLAGDFLSPEYIFLSVGRVGAASENVIQTVVPVNHCDKREYLLDVLQCEEDNSKTLIFVETKRGADELCNFLNRQNYESAAIHGDREQYERNFALEKFRCGQVKILVATAVASRGLDIPNVTHVINFDLPTDIDDYVHRIGRTGRAGNMGKSTAFFDRERNYQLAESLIGILNGAAQEVPDFLLSLSNRSSFGRSGGSGSSGRRGQRQSGNRDFRKDSDYSSFSSGQSSRRNMDDMYSDHSYGGNRGGSSFMPPNRRFGAW